MVALEEGDVRGKWKQHKDQGGQPQMAQVLLDIDEKVGDEHEHQAAEQEEVGLEEVVGDDEANEEGLEEQ